MVTSLLLSLKYWKNDSLLFEQIRNLYSPIIFTFSVKNEKWEKKKKKNTKQETDCREKKMKALIFSQKLDSNTENT